MKPFRNILILVFTFFFLPAAGQLYFMTFPDPPSGCDSLEVGFFPIIKYNYRDTIDEIKWEFGNGASFTKTTDLYNDTVYYKYLVADEYIPRMVINNNTVITGNSIVKVNRSPDAFFYYSDTAEIGTFSYVFMSAGQNDDPLRYTYQWNLSDTTANTRFLIHTFDEEGLYLVRLIVQNSATLCSDTVTRIVEVADTLDIPNVFSPNEDNINDHWVVRSNGKTVYSVKIFARTGTLVYQAESPIITWDGRNQSGQEMAADTYFYLIEPVKYKTRFKKTGFVQLYR